MAAGIAWNTIASEFAAKLASLPPDESTEAVLTFARNEFLGQSDLLQLARGAAAQRSYGLFATLGGKFALVPQDLVI